MPVNRNTCLPPLKANSGPENPRRFLEKKRMLNQLQSEIFGNSINNKSDIVFPPDENPFLIEGDIILTEQQLDQMIEDVRDQLFALKNPEQRIEKPKDRSLCSDLSSRWPFPIPYFIDTATGVNPASVLAAIRRWEEETCIRFIRKDSTPSGNSIRFTNGKGCSSYVGMFGGSQNITLQANGCNSVGIVAHEIAHALGAYHEQSRADRDSYVNIIKDNIQPGAEHNFWKQSSSVDYGVGYDYGSLMHYGSNFFSKDFNKPTMITRDPMMQDVIGQSFDLTFFDVKKMNLAYCGTICTNTLHCSHQGYPDPNNCNQCKCPTPYGGTHCNRLLPTDCGNLNLTATQFMKTISTSGAKTCYYLITAPAGRKIQFKVLNKYLLSQDGVCRYNYIEIKLKKDFTKYGPRFCKEFPTISISENDQIMVVYQGTTPESFFTMEYRST